jgi:hypothetical protein
MFMKPELSAVVDTIKVRSHERSGGQERRGSMMTYKTYTNSTIMRVAGSATSAMRKPQTDKRVRNDEACEPPPLPPPPH